MRNRIALVIGPVCLLAALALLAACTPAPAATPTPSAVPTTAPAPGATTAPVTSVPPATAPATKIPPTGVPPTSAPATATARPSDGTPPPAPQYLDDRSSPWSLMLSFANALNERQFLRAYSYWEPDAPQLQPFEEFEQGYVDTASVSLTIGAVTGDAGAGQVFYSVPVTLIATTTGGTTQTFAGCYILHLSNPAVQGTPPFQPLAIRSASVQTVPGGTDPAPIMAQACAPGGTPQGMPIPTPPTPAGTERGFYLDDRSGGAELVQSFVNALNRHEIARAYSYWEPYSEQLPPFDEFERGYGDTESVALTLGTVTSGVGAGNLYYQVPVTLVATSTGGTVTTYVGCYVLHLGSPGAQAQPPFQPLGIQSATVQVVPAGTDPAGLMAEACPVQ